MDGRAGDGMNHPRSAPLVGRRDALADFGRALDATADGTFQFLGLVGEPGAGKTRLLGELASAAKERKLPTLWGRAAEFENLMPFGVVVDALDDHLESVAGTLCGRLGAASAHLLATAFPSLSAELSAEPPGELSGEAPDEPDPGEDFSGLARYRLYRTVRQMLGELADPSGLVLILDDVHWADDPSVELLDHLVRHPPRGRVLVAVAYRPAQASPRLAALVETAVETLEGRGRRISVDPLDKAEVEEFLGPGVSRARRQALYEASGGNPFYLEALARSEAPIVGGHEDGELPRAVKAALQVELTGLSPATLLVAQGAAVAADEFEPALVAVAAQVTEDVALKALDEMVARDVVRQAQSGRFRFRHPLVRHATYGSAAAGWRLAAHARIAGHLARLGASPTVRAHHVERSARFGDHSAITTLVEAARAVTLQAPATAAHWLEAALRLMPDPAESEDLESPGADPLPSRLALRLELVQVQTVSGRAAEGRETAWELLRLLPPGDYARRARAVQLCAVMERQLGRLHEARAIVLDELRRMPDPQASVAVVLRVRLVADRLMRVDTRGAQAVLDLMPESAPDWGPGLELAVASMRPLPAYAEGRIAEAVRYAKRADGLFSAASDDHLAECLDAVAFLCWTEVMMGRYDDALRHLDRSVAVARSTGQSYILAYMLAARARAYTMIGRLADAGVVAEEAAEVGRLLRSREALGFALTQQCLVASWSGDHDTALRLGEEAVKNDLGSEEWWAALARYARAVSLVNAGRLDEGAAAVLEACQGVLLDPGTLVACSESLAHVDAARGRPDEATKWAEIAAAFAHPELDVDQGLVLLARAHALRPGDPAAAAEVAADAERHLLAAERRTEAGRAALTAGLAYGEAGQRSKARERLRAAAELLEACGARGLHAHAVREQRRLGVRVPSTSGGRRGDGELGLSPREREIATLVAEGCTNQQIAEKLFLSVRTVETHLSRVFTKLGVTSRVGVATALNRRV
jgi:DNA-binding CsgD family transcriptional regulator